MNIIITGAAMGLGAAILKELSTIDGANVIGLDIADSSEHAIDITDPDPAVLESFDKVDVLINCAGTNYNEWFDQIDMETHNRVIDVNANGIVNMTRGLLPQLAASRGAVINIVSNAASIPMTSSLSYNMSKAAALMATKQLAHELTPKYGITVMSISPNKLAGTAMSRYIDERVCEVRGWTPEFAAQYQRKSLMHGNETDPSAVARLIRHLLVTGDVHYLSGCDIPFGK